MSIARLLDYALTPYRHTDRGRRERIPSFHMSTLIYVVYLFIYILKCVCVCVWIAGHRRNGLRFTTRLQLFLASLVRSQTTTNRHLHGETVKHKIEPDGKTDRQTQTFSLGGPFGKAARWGLICCARPISTSPLFGSSFISIFPFLIPIYLGMLGI